MGRGCTMDEWVHFQKLPEEGRVPNSSYWYVLCRHCVVGFEQKQLFNAPAKLTGRRSAMRAHLKICPMYATQYKMEQSAQAGAAAAASATIVTTPEATTETKSVMVTASPAPGEKRKRRVDGESGGSRGGRGKHCMMEEWEHFTRLQDEGYIGKSNFFYAVCKYCQHAFDEAAEDQKPLFVPEKMVGRREKMRKHLSLCPHFKGELPPLDRRLHQRGNGVPPSVVFSALAAGAVAGLGATTVASTTDSEPSVASIGATNGSSRLALDEWHYFTRLERKKDSAYYYARCNFCQQAFEAALESMKATMEPTIVMGRKSNMQTHLAKCPHVPKDASAIAEYSASMSGLTITAAAEAAPLDGTVPSEPKQAKVDVVNGPPVPHPDASAVHRALVQLLIEHHLPFEWVESDSAKQLFRALAPEVADNLLPSATDYRACVLDDIHDATLLSELTKLQELIPVELGASAFSADAVDTLPVAPVGSWPIMLHCNLLASQQLGNMQLPAIDGVVTNGKAIVSLSFLRAQKPEAGVEAALAHDHGLEVARWLDGHIRLCVDSAKLALAAVVLPYNTITQRAVGILRSPAHWPQVVFLPDMEDMLQFPMLKLLATAEMFTVVSSLIEVWQLESIRSCVMERLSEMDGGVHSSPFRDWESCATLIRVLLDDKTFEASTKRGAANAKKLVENALNRSLLERVYNLLHAFMNAFSSCRAGLTLSETLVQLGALFTATEGFVAVQLALEVVWEQMEQPLFVVAHALNPRLRLRDLNSTDITKLSTLSDLSVTYFMALFGRKPNLLRGEVTAYLHTSQRVFTSEFSAEFPVVDDYFRYLSDNYPSLSMLMQVLQSFSSVSLASHQHAKKSGSTIYTSEEQQKLDYLRGRWEIAPDASPLGVQEEGETKSRIAAHNDRSGAAMLNAGVVVDEWKEALETKLHARGVDFSLLEDEFDGVDESDAVAGTGAAVTESAAACGLKLPSLELDDDLTFPSSSLRAELSMKVPLKELFKTAEATI
uniref:BED-type domain-containing protein n=1 Tax=Phytophthora ramorum TaxID=164328 RepID=H3H3Z5_PHYRM